MTDPVAKESQSEVSPGSIVSVALRARKYQLGCLICVLSLLLIQIFFGFLSVSLFKTPQAFNFFSWTNVSDLAESVAHNGPASLIDGNIAKKSVEKQWRLVACAMVHNEAAYLMEWIEFHRLQGVDHFVFYTYFSTDLLEYIPMLYENADIWKMVEVIPARFFAQDPRRNLTVADFKQNREWSMVDCVVRYSKLSHWLLLLDAGHFVYSPNDYKSILAFISHQTTEARKTLKSGEELFTAVKIPTVRFGTSGVKDKFQTWMTPNAYTGGAELNYEPYLNSEDQYPLVIESNPMRAPHRELDENVPDLPDCSELGDDDLHICSEGTMVALIKSGRCPPADIAECIKPTENLIYPELSLLRADNHNWRALNHVRNARYWDYRYNKTFELLDSSWFSTVRDEGKFRFIEPIRKAISKVKPRIFVDVNRTCRADAIKNGQQVVCPASHPYPFGNLGIKFLKDCCKYDKEWDSAPMTINSNSCFNESAIPCPDPPGVQKWLHRSCCIYENSTADG